MEYFKSLFGTHENAHTHILIAYGSATGCSESFANFIYKHKIKVYKKDVKCLNDVDIDNMLKYNINILLVSTTGDGEFPDNSLQFWRKIRKRKEILPINYILCGFGSTDYNSFCHSSKCLRRQLKRLGANPLMEATFIDQENDEQLDKFLESMQKVCDKYINDKQNSFIDNITNWKW